MAIIKLTTAGFMDDEDDRDRDAPVPTSMEIFDKVNHQTYVIPD